VAALAVLVVGLGLAPLLALAARARGTWPVATFAESASVSIATGALAATAAVLMVLPVAHRLARRRAGGGWADACLTLTFVTPAAVLGVGLIAVWNRPGLGAVYGGLAILVLGSLARYAVLAARPIAIAFAQSSPHLDEAAALAGASWLRRLAGILIPAHAGAIAGGWAMVFAFSLRDLEMSVLYYPPGRQPLAVRIFTLEANGSEAVVAALATGHVLLTAAVLLGAAWLLRKLGRLN
jgi:iron(III) transport system permease protein